ncbi:MAG: cupin domain-containing protein [Bacteroidia bacterium]
MNKLIKVFLFFIVCLTLKLKIAAQTFNLNALVPKENFENIYSEKIAEDSLSSSFIIWIKKEVKLHKHLEHSEHVYILEGEGEMQLGEKWINIKSGDLIFIPKNTPHKVKTSSTTILKALSIQSPFFDGSDRIVLE